MLFDTPRRISVQSVLANGRFDFGVPLKGLLSELKCHSFNVPSCGIHMAHRDGIQCIRSMQTAYQEHKAFRGCPGCQKILQHLSRGEQMLNKVITAPLSSFGKTFSFHCWFYLSWLWLNTLMCRRCFAQLMSLSE